MTTEPRPHAGHAVSRVLVGAVVVTLVAGLGLALVGGLAVDAPAAYGALVGTLLAVAVLAFGSFSVNVVAGVMPAASLMVALLTYALQVVLMVVVLLAISRSGLLDDTLRRGWLAGAVIAGTLVWMVAQVVLTTRTRIPVYDLPERRAQTGPAVRVDRSEAGHR